MQSRAIQKPQSQIERVEEMAVTILRENGNRIRGVEIYEWAKEKWPDMFDDNAPLIPKSTFLACLSVLKNDPNSLITRAIGEQGYYLDYKREADAIEVEPEESDSLDEEKASTAGYFKGESLLYPLLVQWLGNKGYFSKNTSGNKSGGRWGNPDVTGIKVTSIANTISLEVLTVEAKIGIENWRQFIFE
jgi:hypothetical protein